MESKTQESYMNKYQMHIACSYGYKLECVDDKFSKPFKTCLCKDLVYNVINCMIQEIKYWNEVMKKNILTKNLLFLNKTMKMLRNLLNVGSVIIIKLIMML